ncbi:S1 RNA binding domain-containing protein [Besnoitia besnoiti]|uniref:S1 RNA binding domain-containing protein n=1 Tax=Besnoitia besnoiti TaxID=94643 RepID=A0A2A9MAE4_BESBE|nr:S1 RNA binding domain-containing protein [Besnoitia besnoiti]PFH32352.1 S1 RNA binding domain-containing protein [Besnoitia besnoiti]
MFDDEFGEAFDPRYDREPSEERPPGKPPAADIYRGVVKRLQSYGAFVKVADLDREGLLHISRISDQRVESVEDVLAVGQEIWVKVLSQEDGKLRLCMKSVNQHDGTERESLRQSFAHRGEGGGIKTPELDSIHQGTIRRIQDFGAFVSIEGFDRDGLLHISCISSQKLDKVDDVLAVGDKVWVKVTKVDEGGKYGLDMRGISQKDGADNDPNNLSRTSGTRSRPQKEERITFDAVYNITCQRCGGKGHMTHECYNPGGNKYEMLEDDGAERTARAAAPQLAYATGANAVQVAPSVAAKLSKEWKKTRKAEKKARKKEEKARKKHKKHKAAGSSSNDSSSSDDSDDSDSSSDSDHKKKSRKRKRKEKKSKHRKKAARLR